MISLVLGDTTLPLTPENGYNVVTFDLGYPQPREVADYRTLADGTDDRTRFFGARTVSLGIRTTGDRWTRIRELSRFMVPSARPYLTYDDSGVALRILLRPAAMNYGVSALPYQDFLLQWVAPNGAWETANEQLVVLTPTFPVEPGFTFDFGFDLAFPPNDSSPGSVATVSGNAGCPPVIDIYGPCSTPRVLTYRDVKANGAPKYLEFNIILSPTQYLRVDTRERTVLLDGRLNRYGTINPGSSWWTLLEGSNRLRFQAATYSGNARAVVTYRCQFI